MNLKAIVSLLLVVAALAFITCSSKSDNGTQPSTTPTTPTFSDSNVSYLYQHRTAGDTIDSTGSYFVRDDTTFWVSVDGATRDTVKAVVTVSHDTARVPDILIPPSTVPLTLTGVLANGSGTTFAGSVWRVTSLSGQYGNSALNVEPPAGTAMYLYFDSSNHKVYSLETADASTNLQKALILQCPRAFFGEYMIYLGYIMDAARSDCDTMWVKWVKTAGSLQMDSGYVVANPATQVLDVYQLPNHTKLPISLPLD